MEITLSTGKKLIQSFGAALFLVYLCIIGRGILQDAECRMPNDSEFSD